MSNVTYRKREDAYYIQKMINGHLYIFGKFKTLKEAEIWRDYFKRHNWNTGLIGVAETNGVIDKSRRFIG